MEACKFSLSSTNEMYDCGQTIQTMWSSSSHMTGVGPNSRTSQLTKMWNSIQPQRENLKSLIKRISPNCNGTRFYPKGASTFSLEHHQPLQNPSICWAEIDHLYVIRAKMPRGKSIIIICHLKKKSPRQSHHDMMLSCHVRNIKFSEGLTWKYGILESTKFKIFHWLCHLMLSDASGTWKFNLLPLNRFSDTWRMILKTWTFPFLVFPCLTIILSKTISRLSTQLTAV